MKTFIILIFLSVFVFSPLSGQDVSDIRVERSGDMITVHYRIAGSTSNQLFRVSILCSIDGGLKLQPRSITGDAGNNITGGREDYTIMWDVLKDVDEITTAEFFITAELTRDLTPDEKTPVKKFTIKGKMLLMGSAIVPGPKFGLRIGIAGNYGFQGEIFYGRITLIDKYLDTWDDPKMNRPGLSLALSKRVINSDKFQLHFSAGYRENDLFDISQAQLINEGGYGPEVGILVFMGKRLIVSANYYHLTIRDPDEWGAKPASPLSYFEVSTGIRF